MSFQFIAMIPRRKVSGFHLSQVAAVNPDHAGARKVA